MGERTEIRFGGSGGQGVVLAAQVLGKAAMLDGRNVLQTQAYGAEARGSMTKSEVIISEERIGFPAARRIDVLVAMSQEATDELVKDLKETGTLIVDSSSVKDVPPTRAAVWRLPMTDIARTTFGDGLYGNMVMLGVLVKKTGVVSEESMEEAIEEATAKRNAEVNLGAFRRGLQLEPMKVK
ncbi:MAG TPA: 2-oxoacid:acceptor oxidoreductase family protein [Nitrososphaerales archaeon]|nr:2-oxoacid:acceptor oxidoreductase family protein [Nitrososphaerales archaeon]